MNSAAEKDIGLSPLAGAGSKMSEAMDMVMVRLTGIEKHLAQVASSSGAIKAPKHREVGVIVLMATHNDSEHLLRGLSSIERSMKGRKWALVICDDGSNDDSLKICRSFNCSADVVVSLGFEKAPNVSAAKNRCYRAAAHLFDRFPWITWHDPDDIMLPGKASELLSFAIDTGHKVILGSHRIINLSNPGKAYIHDAGRAYHTLTFGPWATLMHSSIVPEDGNVFVKGNDHHEDLCGFWNLRADRKQIGVISSRPVHERLIRRGSHSQGREDAMMAKSMEFVRSRPIPSASESFCSVVYGDSVEEAKVFLRTLRLFNVQPVFILCSKKAYEVLSAEGFNNVFFSVDEALRRGASTQFPEPEFTRAYSDESPSPEIMHRKIECIERAVREYGNTIYLDCDMIVTGRFERTSEQDGDIGLACHGFDKGWENHRFGIFNGVQVFCNHAGLQSLWEAFDDFKKNWAEWNMGDCIDVPHSRFLDQGAFDKIPHSGAKVFYFNRGYNCSVDMACRFDEDEEYDFKSMSERLGIHSGYGIFINGHPVKNFHVHLVKNPWKENWRRLVVEAIANSDLPGHRRVFEIITEIE